MGEVRLLNGDGIFGPDPVRPIVVDRHRRLVARGPKAQAYTVSCNRDHDCSIVDLSSGQALDLDPSTFRQGALQPEAAPYDRTDDWDLEDGADSWGFAPRKATFAEYWIASLSLAGERRIVIFLMVGLAALGSLFLVRFRSKPAQPGSSSLVRAMAFLAGLAGLCFASPVNLHVAIVGGLTLELWFISSCAGTGIALVLGRVLGWSARRFARKRVNAA